MTKNGISNFDRFAKIYQIVEKRDSSGKPNEKKKLTRMAIRWRLLKQMKFSVKIFFSLKRCLESNSTMKSAEKCFRDRD